MSRVCCVLTLMLTLGSALAGTTQDRSDPAVPGFEVAAVRRSPSEATGGSSRMQPGGSYRASNLTLQQLVAIAFNVPTTRVSGGPGWTVTDHFDITAKAAQSATARDVPRLLELLLRERFALRVAREPRHVPAYALVFARDDHRFGAGLRPTQAQCNDPEARRVAAAAPPPANGSPRPCAIGAGPSSFNGSGVLLMTLTDVLARPTGRIVVDKTGLTGRYDINLQWASTPDADGPSIFTAVQEQLGLKLQSDTSSVEFAVIESASRPTEN